MTEWILADALGRQWRISRGGKSPAKAQMAPTTFRRLIEASLSPPGRAAAVLVEVHNAVTGQRITYRDLVHGDLGEVRRISRAITDSLAWAIRSEGLRVELIMRSYVLSSGPPEAPKSDPQPVVPEDSTFVSCELVDQNGDPVPYASYELTLPDKSVRKGSLGAHGSMLVDGIHPGGACTLVFPDFDTHDFAEPTAMAGARGPHDAGPAKASGGGTVHVATATDTLLSIAEAAGFANYETIWNDPGNADLRSKRENPQTLLEGDEVAVPEKKVKEHAVNTGADAKITVFLPKVRVRLKLLASGGTALEGSLANVAATGAPEEIDPDGDGVFDVPLAANAKKLSFELNDVERSFLVGVLGPVNSPAGLRHRLANLGYDAGDEDDEDDEALRWAIEEFEHDHGFSPAGKVDDQLIDRVSEAHGS